MTEPAPRYESAAAIDAIAARLGIEVGPHHQDWPYEVADAARFDDYLGLYAETGDEDQRFVLGMMLIEAMEDTLRGFAGEGEEDARWERLRAVLLRDFAVHAYTIHYWCLWDVEDLDENPDHAFWVTPRMRELWGQAAGGDAD